ncbi:Hypothetical predicted protein [Paramuricea clavata]|uniref:Uncharacterized protein n=1 Tax=Paramuricea clavata TaxID=317549 RepID=A0A6S7FR66_PARCT|nr:Hypothetical predicted protein [Paramuricea clavata]
MSERLDVADLKCVVHLYDIDDGKHSNIKQLSEVNLERIQQAKTLRESKGGSIHHKKQCDSVPELNQFNPSLHGVRLEPFYKKFVLILSQEKSKHSESSPDSQPNVTRLKRGESSTDCFRNLYPKECNFCKKYRQKSSKYHDFCYKEFTRKVANANTKQFEDNDAKAVKEINKNTLLKNREKVIKQAAEYLREDIREYARDSTELQWPLYIEELAAETRPVPSSVRSFLIRLQTDDSLPVLLIIQLMK